MRSRHQKEVATGAKQLTEPFCRDVASELETVATSALKQKQSRHQFARKLRLRHHQLKREGRDKIKLSRHQLHRKGVATSFSGRDNICKRRRSRQHLAVVTSAAEGKRSRQDQVVATSIAKTRGRDIMKQSR